MTKEVCFYAIVAALTGGMIYPFRLPRIPSAAYLLMRMQSKRTQYDRKVAAHRPGLQTMRVSLATRYRGKR